MRRSTAPLITGLIGAGASLVAILTWLGVRPPRVHKYTPPKPQAKTAHTTAKAAAAPRTEQPAKVREQVVDGSVSPVAGAWQYHGGKVSVGGKVFEGYGTLSAGTAFATFDAREWDTFTVSIGMNDDHATPVPEVDAVLEVDGRRWKYRVEDGAVPETFEITLHGGRAVTLRALNTDGSPYTGELTELAFAEPKLSGK